MIRVVLREEVVADLKKLSYIFGFFLLFACNERTEKEVIVDNKQGELAVEQPALIILGNVQDAGSPHAGCDKECCRNLFKDPDPDRRVVALGLIDPGTGKQFLFEATPDLPIQMKALNRLAASDKEVPDGIFLTHAHIGHYAGLMYLGKESMYSDKVPVYAMPRMKSFLEKNGPWDILISNQNMVINELSDGKAVKLSADITVTPFLVPHRDEYSETVGYKIKGPNKTVLFIPDIDKWEKWDQSITEILKEVDFALIDGTFYDGDELPNRDISEVPHPFIIESLNLFDSLSMEERSKIYFIHFNHTNPLLIPESPQSKKVENEGYHIARLNDLINI